MNLLHNLLVAVQIISALVMIGLVLIQHGKGADMGASFGSGASGSLFGATGSANFLSRSTAVCAAVFFACTLTLAFFANDRASRPAGGSSVLEGAAAPAASVPSTGAALVPGSASAPAAAVPAPAPTASSGAGAVPAK
ncbi:preprotein translocase subunit SecG [Variovorax sp. YR752]|jgi:preprotein translocase subunit SecG|uniref:preprotein translocase subunit SecG n=1 Tax=Variovorax sp. YR752 TaxID=1884383 RepID=UPI0031378541